MSAFLEWLSSNHVMISAVSTVVIAGSACVTVWLTRSLVKENKLLRKVGEEPAVIAYLEGDSREPTLINFSLVNVGHGPARHIEFEFDFDERFYGNGRVAPMNNPDRKPFGFLPQEGKSCVFFGSGYGLLGNDRLPPFCARVKWENLRGQKFEEEYKLDVRQFLGIFSPTPKYEKEIADSLKKISKRLDNFASAGTSGRLKVETMTASEAHQRRNEQLVATSKDRTDRTTGRENPG